MPNCSKQRNAVLKELFLKTCGNLDAFVWFHELAESLKADLEETRIVLRQLEVSGFVSLGGMDTTGRGRVSLTMPGVKEAEKMERGFFRRFYEDHVVIWSLVLLMLGWAMTTLSGLVTGLVSKPPTIINNIVVPEKK